MTDKLYCSTTTNLVALLARAREWERTATPEQKAAMREAQRQSFMRSVEPCEHGVRDFEDCADCRQFKRAPTTNDLAVLSDAATQGELDTRSWGDGTKQMGMTNLFNDDAEVCLAECVVDADAKFIAALWNAYRSGDLVHINREGLRHRAISAIAEVLAEIDADTAVCDLSAEDEAHLADTTIAAILGDGK